MKIGLIKEGKTPPDRRVALTPYQCRRAMELFPSVEVVVQSSPIRCFDDEQYKAEGITVQENLQDCDIIIGVKEVPIDFLIPNKTYFFFSHTIKKQPYNRDLLRAILDKKIRLIDYEVITTRNNLRLIGFGRYAGIVGCYNGFLGFGKKTGLFELKPASQCEDREEVEQELQKVKLPKDFKCVITGTGRVGKGALEIIRTLKIRQVQPDEFLTENFDEPVCAVLDAGDYYERVSDGKYDRKEFYADPSNYRSSFLKYAKVADMYIPCHFWNNKSPYVFTREDARNPAWKIKMVADISCDIDGPVATTIRPSTIANPFYGYDPISESETDFLDERAIGVSAVDHHPGELPKDASEDFGNELLKMVLPPLLGNDPDQIIDRATLTKDGKLYGRFTYLQDFIEDSKDLATNPSAPE